MVGQWTECERCLWFGQCDCDTGDCEDYTPLNEHERLEEVIEEKKYEFRHIWEEYMEELDV